MTMAATSAPATVISLEEHQRALTQARADGSQQGEIKANLEALFRNSTETQKTVVQILESISPMREDLARVIESGRVASDAIIRIDGRVGRLEQEHVRPSDTKELMQKIDALETAVADIKAQVRMSMWVVGIASALVGGLLGFALQQLLLTVVR